MESEVELQSTVILNGGFFFQVSDIAEKLPWVCSEISDSLRTGFLGTA